MKTRILALACLALGLLALAACSSDGSSPKTSPIPTQAGGAPTITLKAGQITGQSGKVLLVVVTPGAGGAPLARACISIGSNSFTPPVTVLTDMPKDNPCGAATGQAKFADGGYVLSAGIYTPGATSPEREVRKPVIIVGGAPAEVTVDGAELSG
ncbi:MAG TPA: hypothetical protein VFB90_06900 [Dehalococcoidia bacterium]|nr:hypothetical protein [Dehalococcoidia bacterium]